MWVIGLTTHNQHIKILEEIPNDYLYRTQNAIKMFKCFTVGGRINLMPSKLSNQEFIKRSKKSFKKNFSKYDYSN